MWPLAARARLEPARPARRAIQRDEAEIATWREQEWLRINGGTEAGAWLCFLDESSVSLIPPVRRTWPSRADPATPGPLEARVHGGMCCFQPDRSQALLCFHTQPGSYNDHSLIDGLQQLRRFLRTVTVIWDNLPSIAAG